MRSWIAVACLLLLSAVSLAQESGFVGEWLLWMESGNQGVPAYGHLAIEPAGDTLAVYIDGGPVNLLALEGNRITFDFDWSDLPDQEHVSVLEGTLAAGIIHGSAAEDGTDRGEWTATPLAGRDISLQRADPAALAGIWDGPAIISKHAFDLTEAGRAANRAYDQTIDDPILRCVSDGLIRMSHGPFDIEIVPGEDRIYVLYEDLHEVRRIYTDGRGFPDGIEEANLAMGYSVGRWEGPTFVIETRGLKPAVWDAAGMPISPAAVVTERWYVDDTSRLHIEFSMQDPVNYERPVLMHQVRVKRPANAEIREYSCDPHAFYRSLQLEGRLEEYWGRSRNRL